MGGWGGGLESSRCSEEKKKDKYTGIKRRVDVWSRKDGVFFQRQIVSFLLEATREWSDGSARDTPPTPPTPLRSRRGRARPMMGSGGQVSPVETAPSATTATLVHSATAGPNNMSATHLRGNLPHYGCDYFQITNHSNGESVCIGSSSALQALAEKAL